MSGQLSFALKLPDEVHKQPHSLCLVSRREHLDRFVQPNAGVRYERIERSVSQPECMAAEV